MNTKYVFLLPGLLALFPSSALAQPAAGPAPVTTAPAPEPVAAPATVSPSTAQDEDGAKQRTEHNDGPQRSVSITFSPIHLVSPIVELSAEFKVHPKMSVMAIGGVGSYSGSGIKASAIEVGGQFRYYAFGNFDSGMTVGVEALYLRLDTKDGAVSANGQGLAVSPAVGYKHAFGFGLTLDGQVGVSFMAARATATDGSSSASAKSIFPLLNLNIGWSF